MFYDLNQDVVEKLLAISISFKNPSSAFMVKFVHLPLEEFLSCMITTEMPGMYPNRSSERRD